MKTPNQPYGIPWLAERVFASDARSVAQARQLVDQCLTDVDQGPRDDVVLLTSEVVTNAVQHGAGAVGVRVSWGGGEVRVEVSDRSPAPLILPSLDHQAIRGRGLVLVGGLSSSWGVMNNELGKTVWFTVRG